MKYKVKVTVIDKKCHAELQERYCADPKSGAYPCFNVGDEFVFERADGRDDFWHCGAGTLVKSGGAISSAPMPGGTSPIVQCGGPGVPFCSEAWDAIARYIYTGLQGGSIMRGWMREENTMICCCSDGTRPVIFKIERIDEDE